MRNFTKINLSFRSKGPKFGICLALHLHYLLSSNQIQDLSLKVDKKVEKECVFLPYKIKAKLTQRVHSTFYHFLTLILIINLKDV